MFLPNSWCLRYLLTMMRQDGAGNLREGAYLYHRMARLWESSRVLVGIRTGCSESGTKVHRELVDSGLGFCSVGSRVLQEMWVTDSAWYLRRNGA
jgi:hypothetical protein